MLAVCFMLVLCLAYSLAWKLQASCSSKTTIDFEQVTQCCITEDKLFITAAVRTSNPAHTALRQLSLSTTGMYIYCHAVGVTIDRVWIGDLIY
jgi:hypothetical protein